MSKRGVRTFCSFPDCGLPSHGRGLCSAHYWQWRRGDQLRPRRKAVVGCSVDGCEERHGAKGLCSRHYKYAASHDGRTGPPSDEERFWQKVAVTPGCWLWLGARDRRGYGRTRTYGRTQLAHRVSYVLTVGAIPEGLVLDHLCRNTQCVNPAHLEPVTNEENIRRWAVTLTHCKRGHEFTPENTYAKGNGRRTCRQCSLEARRKKAA